MPTSYHQTIPRIMRYIQMLAPESILNIGAGFGKHGVLCREVLDVSHGRYHKHQWKVRIDGVESCEDRRSPIHDYVYDKMYYQDIRKLISELPSYDVVLLAGVIEHMPKEEGISLIKEIMHHTAKMLLVLAPLYPSARREPMGISTSAYRSRWTPLDFQAFDFSYTVIPSPDGGVQLFSLYSRPASVQSFPVDTIWDQPAHRLGPLHIAFILPHHCITGGLKVLFEQIRHLRSRGHRIRLLYRVNWVCQVQPEVRGVKFPIRCIVNSPQEELPEWYQRADLFVFSSWYEGFSMPPLEAMASGVPVVATSCGGISTYAVPGVNALLVEPGDIESLAAAIAYLLDDPAGRSILSAAGRETAVRFRWSDAIEHLEAALRRVATMHQNTCPPQRVL